MKKLLPIAVLVVAAATALALAMTAAAAKGCPVCGKNLIKNPGAELGRGVTTVGAFGGVPGWTNESGQFGAASYTFPNGFYFKSTPGPKDRGKNYFFGGTNDKAIAANASVGKQAIPLPASAVGRKATLSGWLGNYGDIRAQVRAEFADVAGNVLSTVRIGPVVGIGNGVMALRSRHGKVPPKTKTVTISLMFGPNAKPGVAGGYNLAGADSLSLVLT
jgi:hypothetical protein